MKRTVVITGAEGRIGSVLANGLAHEYNIIPLVRPLADCRNDQEVMEVCQGADDIIHLAWDTKLDNFGTQLINTDNTRMFNAVYKTASLLKTPRVIMASSVHADSFSHVSGKTYKSTETIPTPDSPYGAHKVFLESLGRYYAKTGPEVVCIRFGAVTQHDMPHETNPTEQSVFLSHRDCVSLVHAILSAKPVPVRFSLLYAVSNNANRVHDFGNPFFWEPRDDAQELLKIPEK